MTATADHSPRDATPRAVAVYVAVLCAAAAAVAVRLAGIGVEPDVAWWTLPLLAAVLAAAAWLVVPFRYGGSVDAVNLMEAALAPLLLAFPPIAAVVVAALAQAVDGVAHRLAWIKTVHNMAMWALAAGLGAAVVHGVGPGPLWPRRILGLVAALAVVGLVNNTSQSIVLSLVERTPRRNPRRLQPLNLLGSIGAWAVNVVFGLLFALAFAASPVAAVLFIVPVVVLHLSYRAYTAAQADHARLAAAHRAAGRLSAPLEPMAAVPDFLREVAECFDAQAAELVLQRENGGRDVHRVDRATGRYLKRVEQEHIPSLERLAAATGRPAHFSITDDASLAHGLADSGASDCLTAPLRDTGGFTGAILVLDRSGFHGSHSGELAVLEALARETGDALAKGRLLDDVLAERRKLAEIVSSASDGIFSVSDDGVVLTWNAALERITGLASAEVVGRGDIAQRLHMRTVDGGAVDLTQRPIATLPRDFFVSAADGSIRHLTCSYSAGGGDADSPALVVVARDATPADEQAALREQVSRLVEADAARREVVEQLQHAVVPAPILVEGVEMAAAYEPSDPSAPTGGDLYDWQHLPSGELQLTVVDVLGHGVAATKHALAVTHTLRVVTAAGTPMRGLVASADRLLQAQQPDLVATVIITRYDPATGRLLVASGGHPPALIVTPRREVRQVAASGGVIGWPGAGSDDVVETFLEPGDALVLYTDGLVEARKNILDGMEEVERHAAEAASLPPAELADQLVQRALEGAERRDDTLAVVMRRSYVTADRRRSSWTIPPDPAAASALRRTVGTWLRGHGVDGHDAQIVAGELLSNAVRAAEGGIELHVRFADSAIVLDVSDDGQAHRDVSSAGTARPGHDSERGRGLYLVRRLSTDVDVLTTAEGTTIRATVPTAVQRPSRTLQPAAPAILSE